MSGALTPRASRLMPHGLLARMLPCDGEVEPGELQRVAGGFGEAPGDHAVALGAGVVVHQHGVRRGEDLIGLAHEGQAGLAAAEGAGASVGMTVLGNTLIGGGTSGIAELSSQMFTGGLQNGVNYVKAGTARASSAAADRR